MQFSWEGRGMWISVKLKIYPFLTLINYLFITTSQQSCAKTLCTFEEGLVFLAASTVTWGRADLGFEISNHITEDLIFA